MPPRPTSLKSREDKPAPGLIEEVGGVKQEDAAVARGEELTAEVTEAAKEVKTEAAADGGDDGSLF